VWSMSHQPMHAVERCQRDQRRSEQWLGQGLWRTTLSPPFFASHALHLRTERVVRVSWALFSPRISLSAGLVSHSYTHSNQLVQETETEGRQRVSRNSTIVGKVSRSRTPPGRLGCRDASYMLGVRRIMRVWLQALPVGTSLDMLAGLPARCSVTEQSPPAR
jgi:hypothetical protein